MTIKLLSDLHLEFTSKLEEKNYFPYAGEDVLVLAGDIDSGGTNSIKTLKKFHKEGYPHIVYVPGNHEYYNSGKIDEFNAKLKKFSFENSSWFHYINRDWYADEVTKSIFIGATLWSNFSNNPISEAIAVRGIADFRRIRGFSTAECANRYANDIAFIKSAIASLTSLYPGYKFYVVTHFLPAKVCIAPQYANDISGLNNYFANDLDDYLYSEVPEGLTWLFGHTHTPMQIQHGNTRLICNPYGYEGYEDHLQFNPKCYV